MVLAGEDLPEEGDLGVFREEEGAVIVLVLGNDISEFERIEGEQI